MTENSKQRCYRPMKEESHQPLARMDYTASSRMPAHSLRVPGSDVAHLAHLPRSIYREGQYTL
ncbi:hypothetical protein [Diaphorobacter sp.]|uniref:hypothetical protein n=1 Tax=Diaphorobacter sp. TaxID=1934310 RepID=UPI0028AA7130|nr:hypothetical protein [Diaphorobacter sp.]